MFMYMYLLELVSRSNSSHTLVRPFYHIMQFPEGTFIDLPGLIGHHRHEVRAVIHPLRYKFVILEFLVEKFPKVKPEVKNPHLWTERSAAQRAHHSFPSVYWGSIAEFTRNIPIAY